MIKPGDLIFLPSKYWSGGVGVECMRDRWAYSLNDDNHWFPGDFVAIVVSANDGLAHPESDRRLPTSIDQAVAEDRFLVVLAHGVLFEVDAGGATLL